ncbi:MAG: PQQ-binding-like beta-propeller repeat protein, partial [Planctomycetes bacterium]|nr:PQQ-binding-like beta-propeller repeat protein [Planctomycetota bacterium]
MNITLPCRVWIVAVMLLLGCLPRAWAGDWPQHRFDASRGASSPDDLPDGLSLRWERHLPPPRPAWPESQPWLRFDVSYSPVAAGKLLFVPSMVSDSVTAHDTETGEVRWSFYAEGPVRFAPIVHGGKVYFGSDDGHLYCVDAARGTLLWKFRAGPSDRRVLGNERLISTWPIRTGPVLLDGTVYLTAGIWPFMGIFIHAIDAETGTPQWTNSGYGTTYTVQPHGSPAFASLVPRGHLAATEHGLVVPGGRTEPGSFDRRTGEFRGFNFGGKGGGSHHVTARDGWYFFSGSMRQIVDGKTVAETGASIHDREALYTLAGKQISAVTLESEGEPTKQASRARLRPLWKATLPESPGRLFLKAGSRFYAGAEGEVTAIEVDQRNDTAKIVWRGALEGTPWAMLAADDKLFVVTREGRLLCFAPGDRPRKTVWAEKPAAEKPKAVAVLEATGVREGYAVVLGLDDIETVESIVRASKLHVIVVDSDAKKVDALRRRMDAAGLYGTRVAACTADATTFAMPPYLADLIVVGGKHVEPVTEDAAYAQHVFRWLRPYGGVAYLKTDEKKLRATVQEASLAGAQVRSAGDGAVLLVREGPLPGAADWTHQYADAANSG